MFWGLANPWSKSEVLLRQSREVRLRVWPWSAGQEMQDKLNSNFSYSTLLVKSDVLLWLSSPDPSAFTGGYRQALSCLPQAFLLWLQWPRSLLQCPLCLRGCRETAWYVKWECKGGWSPALCQRWCSVLWALRQQDSPAAPREGGHAGSRQSKCRKYFAKEIPRLLINASLLVPLCYTELFVLV